MLFALRLARRRGLQPEAAQRLERMLGRLHLPPLPEVQAGTLLAHLQRDKKAREGGIGWVLPVALGQGRWGVKVPPPEVEEELVALLEDSPA
jgi:3-dehydroquinate synthetase